MGRFTIPFNVFGLVNTGMASVVLEAEQLAVAPPLDPAQLQVQGSLTLTEVCDPELHRFVIGAVAKVPPFALPQTPFITWATGVTALDAADGEPWPTALVAVTVQV